MTPVDEPVSGGIEDLLGFGDEPSAPMEAPVAAAQPAASFDPLAELMGGPSEPVASAGWAGGLDVMGGGAPAAATFTQAPAVEVVPSNQPGAGGQIGLSIKAAVQFHDSPKIIFELSNNSAVPLADF